MNTFTKHGLLTAAVAVLTCGLIKAQDVKVDRQKYPDANPTPKVERTYSNTVEKQAQHTARSTRYGTERPDHVNNALTKYYPPVFNQSGGSCGSAQAVGYCMTYDMNAYRNTDASLPENQLPTHFTWLHTYAGIDKYPIMNKHGVPSVVDYGGRTYSETFGNQDTSNPDYGYMQGYDKWYRAMFNRTIGGDTFCDANQTTELGREQLKQWLWNHWGDESFYAGGVSGIGVASGGQWGKIPNTVTNRSIGVANMYYVESWGQTYDHAVSIVGYDDRIEFDLDGNGVYGEADKDEIGAWIICNSWGAGWCNQGFIYCPYKYSYAIGTNSIAFNSGHYTWRKDHEPKRVLKILMDHNRRSEISIWAGIASDTTATMPQDSEVMPFFNYAGDGTKSSPAPQVPMLGKWKGKMNYEPMEFGYDVTDLSSGYDLNKPLKYFLVINTKSTAIDSGHVYKLSLMDYTFDPEGLEIPARIDTVMITGKGNTTVVAVTAAGNQIYAPLNATLDGKQLTWNEPKKSSYNIVGYYVYKNDKKIAEVPSSNLSYTVDDPKATYYVATAYEYRDRNIESTKSTPARSGDETISNNDNDVLRLNDATASVEGLLKDGLQEATIEFWIKPASVKSNNQQIGDNWGTFLFCTTNTGQIQCGWDANNRVVTTTGTLKIDKWHHIAITVDGNLLTLYVNGMKKSSLTSASYKGIPALSRFCIGTNNGLFDGEIDELRIWSKALSQIDIYRNKSIAIAKPSAQSELLAYYPMQIFEQGGQRYIKDLASGYDMAIGSAETIKDESVLTGAITDLAATFTLPEEPALAGEPLNFKSTALISVVDWQWSAPDAINKNSNVINPYFVFEKPGTYEITHSVTDINGNSAELTQSLTVVSPEAPVADFDIANTTLGEGEIFSLANKSTGESCIFTWLLPGADTEEMHSVNAAVSYSLAGVYPITLKAVNAGGESEKTIYVTVERSAPRVAFNVHPNIIMLGETTYLVDKTRQSAENWIWTLSNGVHDYEVHGQHSSFVPKHPGYYDVTLEASNELGTSSATEEGKLIVINADSKNGLSMTGSESLESTTDLFAEGTKAFTIEWWMQPYTANGALNFSTESGEVAISTDNDGNMQVAVGGKAVSSGDGFVLANRWHHYAITYTFGTVKFYRDGVLIASPTTRIATSTDNWGKLTISGGENGYQGQLDELRIWNKALSLANLKGYINAPLSDIETLVANSGLVAYYDFNQNGGSVKDRTSNAIDLSRIGFGPDGDAWGLSTGVFTLDLDPASDTEIIDADGLTHVYEAIREGKTQNIEGTIGAIRFAFEQAELVKIYTLDGMCVFNDTVEGVHILPFAPGIYVANGQKIVVR